MVSSPLVSVVIPSFNQGHFIEDTLNSVLGQDYPEIEIIVVDGASTDSTVEILERLSDRIRYVSEPDSGQSNAINKGFAMSSGGIVSWLNSDDTYPDRTAISGIVDAFERLPRADFVYGDFIEINQRNEVLKFFRRPPFSFQRLLRVGYISQPATFFRKRVIDELRINEDLNYAMDLEYWLRGHAHGFRFTYLRRLIAAERLHEDAKCVRDTGEMTKEALAVRRQFGAIPGHRYRLTLFLDRILLYAYRLAGIGDLISYARNSNRLTVPLNFKGALKRTLMLRLD